MTKDKRYNPLKDYMQIFAQAMIINNLNISAMKIHKDFISHVTFLSELNLKTKSSFSSQTDINIRTVQRLVQEIKRQFTFSYYKKSAFYMWDENSFERFIIRNPAIVLRSDYISRILYNRPLWEHEAKWVDNLAPFTKNLDPIPSLILSKEYSIREEYHFLKTGNSEIQHQDTADLDRIISLQPWNNHIKENLLNNILFCPTLIMSPFNESKYYQVKRWILSSLNKSNKEVVLNTSLWNEEGIPFSWDFILEKLQN